MADQPPIPDASPAVKSEIFRCPECGAELRYDAAERCMLCDHCGHKKAIAAAEGNRAVVEHDLEGGLARASARGLGDAANARRTSRCQECGATVSFEGTETATECEFCGSAHVLEQPENRRLIRPESLVPFAIDRPTASKAFTGWLAKLWFRPSDLKKKARVSDIAGVYVPYWTFDTDVHSDWTAEAGYYYYVTETYTTTDDEGNPVTRTRQVQRVRWEPAWGARDDEFDDHLVCASKGLPPGLADKLRTFDTAHLRPYAPAFLSGWRAEEYAIGLNDAWDRALGEIKDVTHGRCAGDVPGDVQRFLNVSSRFANETFKHIMLPIWVSAYRYRDQIYRFLVNGQTGEVTGRAPWSWIKITLAVVALVAAIAGVVVLMHR